MLYDNRRVTLISASVNGQLDRCYSLFITVRISNFPILGNTENITFDSARHSYKRNIKILYRLTEIDSFKISFPININPIAYTAVTQLYDALFFIKSNHTSTPVVTVNRTLINKIRLCSLFLNAFVRKAKLRRRPVRFRLC